MLKSRLTKLIADGSGDGGSLISRDSVGRPVAGDTNDDPLNLYVPGAGLSLTISDYTPLKVIKGFSVATVGNVAVQFVNGENEVLKVTAADENNIVYPGFMNTIYTTGTTAKGIKPLL